MTDLLPGTIVAHGTQEAVVVELWEPTSSGQIVRIAFDEETKCVPRDEVRIVDDSAAIVVDQRVSIASSGVNHPFIPDATADLVTMDEAWTRADMGFRLIDKMLTR